MTYRDHKKAALAADPQLRREYAELAARYGLIDAIIAARIEKQLTQAQLAAAVGTKQANISRFESGNSNPTVEFLGKIAVALGKRLEIRLR